MTLKGASVGLGKHLITLSGPQITTYLKVSDSILREFHHVAD